MLGRLLFAALVASPVAASLAWLLAVMSRADFYALLGPATAIVVGGCWAVLLIAYRG
jgi:hypothetical protein